MKNINNFTEKNHHRNSVFKKEDFTQTQESFAGFQSKFTFTENFSVFSFESLEVLPWHQTVAVKNLSS